MMLAIGGIRCATTFGAAPNLQRHASSPDTPTAQASRALIPVRPVEDVTDPPSSMRRPAAAFLAHLIATDHRLPQTRERRRAEPGEAVNCYAAASRKAARPTGGRFARSL
jgi:hypothetical protein